MFKKNYKAAIDDSSICLQKKKKIYKVVVEDNDICLVVMYVAQTKLDWAIVSKINYF